MSNTCALSGVCATLLNVELSMKHITLTQGQKAIVDDDDYDNLNNLKWFATKNRCGFYARRSTWDPKNKKVSKPLIMHRVVVGAGDGEVVDHINGNSLDNRKSNLRVCSNAQNCRNRKRNNKNNSTSKYKGVSWNKKKKLWESVIGFNYKDCWLGYFKSEKEAAEQYDIAAQIFFGEFASLNFPLDKDE